MTAYISNCGKYRYHLGRGDMTHPLVFIMLNPSTADAELDDPTIRRCTRFAKDNGYTGLAVVNLYAYRATNPKELLTATDPVGSYNDAFIMSTVKGRDVVCAWGNNAKKDRVNEVMNLISGRANNVYALGIAKTGMPKHPLYLPADSKLIPFTWRSTK